MSEMNEMKDSFLFCRITDERGGVVISRFTHKTNNWSKVYFVQGKNGGPIKIGHTENVENRIKQMQTGNPDEILLLHVTRGGKIFEDELHEKFKEFHYRGEWFIPSQEIIEYINELRIRDKKTPNLLNVVELSLACGEILSIEDRSLLVHLVNGIKTDDSPSWDRYHRLVKYYYEYLENPEGFIEKYKVPLNLEVFK